MGAVPDPPGAAVRDDVPMHLTTYAVTAAVVAWLVVAPRAAEAENIYGVCFANSKRVECHAGDDAEKTTEYVRKQCRFWSEKPCTQVATCSTHGYFVTATSRTNGDHAVRCGVPKASREDAMDFVRRHCGGDCLIMTHWIGPPPGPDPAKEKEREDAERRAEEQARLEKERQDRERLEAERKEKERQDRERLDKEREERERLEKARIDKQREETARHEQEQAERKRQAQQREDEVRRERARIDAEREAERQRAIARGFQLQREAHAANNKLGQSSGTVAGSVFAVEGGNAGTEGTTRAVRAGFGFGGRFLPVMTNTEGGNVVEESTQSTGGGFAFEGRLELWARYRQRWGVGPSIEAGVAGMALPGGGMYAVHAGVSANAYYGNRAGWSIEGELGLHGQIVGSSGLFIDATITGSGSYRIWRLGAGPSWCVTPAPGIGGFCDTKLYARLLLDWTSAATTTARDPMTGGSTGGGAAKVLRLGVASKRAPFGVGLEIELGTGYPAPGETRFALESGEDRTGVYFAFLMRKNWTWHSGKARATTSAAR